MPEKLSNRGGEEQERSFLEDYRIQDKPEVHKAAKKKERLTGEKGVFADKSKRIGAYLERLEKVFLNEDEQTRRRNINLIKPALYENTQIKKENFPESYFDHQKILAREAGMGEVSFDQKQKQEDIEKVQQAQRDSLDAWIEYLTGEECRQYSSDVRFFVMRGVLLLGDYDPDKHNFSKRRPETTSPFATINHLAVSKVMGALEAKHHNKEDGSHSQQVLDLIDKKKSFGDMYEAVLKEIDESVGEREYQITDGQWVTFKQGSDPKKMVDFLQGKAKYICIAESGHAHRYLSSGDVHIYISQGKDGNLKTARMAIAAKDDRIYEIRGDHNANEDIDEIISQTDKLSQKSTEFSNGQEYLKKDSDMKKLTKIDRKCFKRDRKTGEAVSVLEGKLNQEELKFLYEIDSKIEGFGYEEDPRIEEITNTRDKRSDITLAIGYKPEEISLTEKEALQGNIKYHYGYLDLRDLTSAEGLKLPETVGGYLDLRDLTSAEGLKLPESVGDCVYLNKLSSAEKDQLRKQYPNLKIE